MPERRPKEISFDVTRNGCRELSLGDGSYLEGYPFIRICCAVLKNGVVGLSKKNLGIFYAYHNIRDCFKKGGLK
jgi:hypothetical protein